MGSKSQRKKERHAKKRQEKRKEQDRRSQTQTVRGLDASIGSNERHRQRLQAQKPLAWEGEIPEDVAVFDDAVLVTLSAETGEQVAAIRAAVASVLAMKGDEAADHLAGIPRASVLSEWRLFVRGLVDWLAEKPDAARETWARLDFQRRPGRIAIAMMTALRSGLGEMSVPKPEAVPAEEGQSRSTSESPWDRLDDQLLYQAKLLRRARLERAAIRIAEAALTTPEELPDALIGPEKVAWLRKFAAEYGDTEPELVQRLGEVAVLRAYSQNYFEVFVRASEAFRGPQHDLKNRLLTLFYFSRFEDDRSASARSADALRKYLNEDLVNNTLLPQSLRRAIASQIHLNLAMTEIYAGEEPDDLFAMFSNQSRNVENVRLVRTELKTSIECEPRNLAAHQAYVDWIEGKLDDECLNKDELDAYTAELLDVMRLWSQSFPDDVEPRLWLVDYLLENEKLDEARPHVEHLAASRVENPQVRAIPWKWQMLEAMRLCRRKAWLKDVPARLDEAGSLWPAWLPRHWLAYFRAALALRSGEPEAFEQQRQQICQDQGVNRDSLVDSCMMLGAAQHMRVAAADLRPLRVTIDAAMKKLDELPLDDLLAAGAFFWDLHRANLAYPAQRPYASGIVKTLFRRLAKETKLVVSRRDDEVLQKGSFVECSTAVWNGPVRSKTRTVFPEAGDKEASDVCRRCAERRNQS